MVSVTGLTLLVCCASAAVVEEEAHPLREVSPEEFHALAMKQETHDNQLETPVVKPQAKSKGKKDKAKARNLITKPKENKNKQNKEALTKSEGGTKTWKEMTDEERGAAREERRKQKEREQRQAKFKAEREKEMALFDDINMKQLQEEAELQANGAAMSAIKANKTLACTENNKDSEILSFFLSPMAGGVSTKQAANRDKCMRSQLDQHCMPYESFPATSVEPCAEGDWSCANKRVLVDHANCMTKSVDWDAIQYYTKETGKSMWDVLGAWCSHVKLMKEISSRIQLDEKFVTDYPAVLVLQDHVILDKEWAEEVAKDWVKNYPENWDMVQIDPSGAKGPPKKDKVMDFRGKEVYRPSWKGQYSGFQAILMKTRSVPTLLEKMQGLNVMPIDWLTKGMNDMPSMQIFSWDAGITTTAQKGLKAQKEIWMPNVPACSDARKFREKY